MRRRTQSSDSRGISKANETKVPRTKRDVDVKETNVSPRARKPLPKAAVDQRRQIVGTDDPKGRAK